MNFDAIKIKLSKKNLMRMREGCYLVGSWLVVETCKPNFEEGIAPLLGREEQWRRIVSAGENQNVCTLFASKKDYQTWYELALPEITEKFSRRRA